jgi:hypothetical protein
MNETAIQIVRQHHFPEPCGGKGGGCCGTNWPREVVEMATLCEFDEIIDSLPTSVTHLWVTLSDFVTHFTLKRIQRVALKKMTEVIIKLDKMLKD